MCLFILIPIHGRTATRAFRGGQHRQSRFFEKWRDRLLQFRDRICSWRSEDSYVDPVRPRETQTVYYPIFYDLSSLGVPPPYSSSTDADADAGANNVNVNTYQRNEEAMPELHSDAFSEATTEVEDDDLRIYEAISHGLSLSFSDGFPYTR